MLITGGSRGIGAATSILAAERGFDVCLSYKSNRRAADQTADAIAETGRQALVVQADIAVEASIVALFREAIDRFSKVDVLVNNAAILETQQPLVNFEQNRLHRIFAVNVIGTILACREAVGHMSRSRGGRGGSIINVSSAAARLGSPHEYIDYACSKGAIDTLTVGLAKEVAAEGIRVNAVRPGAIHTEIHATGGEPDRVERVQKQVPLQRGGTPHEIAEAILWLASDQATYATGAILDVTGGI